MNPTQATRDQWPYFYQADAIKGPPCGDRGGQFDGVSLGYDRLLGSQGGFIVVGLGDGNGHACAVDDGTMEPDLAVYGNQFFLDATGNVYSKVATVDVTDDLNGTWHRFPPSYDPNYLSDKEPRHYINFAGVHPTSAGGDRFDLKAVGLGLPFMACYIRLTDGGTLYPDYGDTQTDLYEGGAALDAVEALHSAPLPGGSP